MLKYLNIYKLISIWRLADKELQRKSLEDSLNSERSCGANRETKMQVCPHHPSCFIFHHAVTSGQRAETWRQPWLILLTRIAFVSEKLCHLSSFVFSPTGFAQWERVTEGRDPETAGTAFWSGQRPAVAVNGPVFLCCTDSLYPLVFLWQAASQLALDQIQKRWESFHHQILLFIWGKIIK